MKALKEILMMIACLLLLCLGTYKFIDLLLDAFISEQENRQRYIIEPHKQMIEQSKQENLLNLNNSPKTIQQTDYG